MKGWRRWEGVEVEAQGVVRSVITESSSRLWCKITSDWYICITPLTAATCYYIHSRSFKLDVILSIFPFNVVSKLFSKCFQNSANETLWICGCVISWILKENDNSVKGHFFHNIIKILFKIVSINPPPLLKNLFKYF